METHPSKQRWLPHHQRSREQGLTAAHPGAHCMATHPTPAGQPWDRLGWDRMRAPGPWVSLWGQPQPKEQPGVVLSASSSPKPKGTRFFCGGYVTPQTSQSTKVFIPAPTPSSCSRYPLPQQYPGSPSPSQTQHPREHRVLVGCVGAVRHQQLGRVPFLPQTSSGADVHPTPQDVTPLPILPSPEPSSAPRTSLGTWGSWTIPCAASLGSTGKPQVGNSL